MDASGAGALGVATYTPPQPRLQMFNLYIFSQINTYISQSASQPAKAFVLENPITIAHQRSIVFVGEKNKLSENMRERKKPFEINILLSNFEVLS